MTIFGDTLEPRGGCVWLGSLIQLARPLGVSESLVRTSVYRLARETMAGRNVVWGAEVTTDSHQLVTGSSPTQNTASMAAVTGTGMAIGVVVVIPRRSINRKTRDTIRKELKWQGFGMLAADVPDTPHGGSVPREQYAH
ncbi:MAG: hypothetical protein CM1200mP20_03850 [Pseudomonadota bacterium]|nr:MAG: hypothetical protein CM1200mP20_03850 [Pseudomonadota bacterium]